MLQNLLKWAATATASAKYYMRTSPFVLFNHSTCRPEDENTFAKDGSTLPGIPLMVHFGIMAIPKRPERAQEPLLVTRSF